MTRDYGDFDNASNLNREGVFRLNIGIGKATYDSLFPDDGENDKSHDFTSLDRLMPHPVYGKQHWVCILNPSDASFETLKPLIKEAYDRAVARIHHHHSST